MLPPRLVTETKMARRLGVEPAWLHPEADAGRLPHVRAGSRYLFDPELIEQLLLERAQQFPAAAGGDSTSGQHEPQTGAASGAESSGERREGTGDQ